MSDAHSNCASEEKPVEYRSVPGWVSYRVGDDGSVWSCHKNKHGPPAPWRMLKATADKHGYLYVDLKSKGHRERKYIHTLVLEVFVGPRPEKADGCHDPDPTPTNNRLNNLKWGTRLENVRDAIRHGRWMRGSMTPLAKISERQVPIIRELCNRYPGKSGIQSFLARWFGVNTGAISEIHTRKTWRHVA